MMNFSTWTTPHLRELVAVLESEIDMDCNLPPVIYLQACSELRGRVVTAGDTEATQ